MLNHAGCRFLTRYIVESLFVVAFMGFGTVVHAGDGKMQMTDPILGLNFDPSVVRFESAPAEALHALNLKTGPYWLFAAFDDSSQSGLQYGLIAGFMPILTDTDPPKRAGIQPDFGTIYVVQSGQYRELGVADLIYSEAGELPDNVARGLMRDAISRLIDAYGGVSELRKVLGQSDGFTKPAYADLLASELRRAGVIPATDKSE